MSTLLKPIKIRKRLLDQGVIIFSPAEFKRIFEVPGYKAKYFLEKQTKQGLFQRLKKGLYALKTDPPSEEEVANALYRPSYLSFEYALAYYNLLAEMPYKITCATTKPTRSFLVNEVSFKYYKIKKKAYTGYYLLKKSDKSFLIAEPEKALADCLYFETLGKKTASERLQLKSIDEKKLISYAKLFDRKSLVKRVKEVL
jgi:predicted transcriptional regulator of viral defense system